MRVSQIIRFVAIATISAAIVAVIPNAARAQTISACSAQKSGSMYRVGVAGAPSDCTNANHRKETWNVQGPQGPQGAPGLSGVEIVQKTVSVAPSSTILDTMICPAGKRVLGGGYGAFDMISYLVIETVPRQVYVNNAWADGWAVQLWNSDPAHTGKLMIYAVCAKAAP